MAAKEVFLRGKCKYFKLLDRGDIEYQCWNLVLYLTPESHAQFLELKKGNETTDGIMNDVKLDDEGYHVNLKRPWAKKFKGVETLITPPVVLDKDNIPWNNNNRVGDGSDITCKIEYYTFKPPFKQKRGSAIRLVSARVEDLVPYEPNRDLTGFEKEQTKGLLDQKPAQPF